MSQTAPIDQTETTVRDLVAEMTALRLEIAERTQDLTDEQRQKLASRLARQVMAAAVAMSEQRLST